MTVENKMAEKRKSARRIGDETVRTKTGKGWKEWFKILNNWDVKERSHTQTARHFREQRERLLIQVSKKDKKGRRTQLNENNYSSTPKQL